MADGTARLLPGSSRRRRWEWRAVAVVVIVALCAFAATSRIRIRAHVPHSRHHRPAQRNDSSLPVVLWHGLGDSCCASHSIGYVANLISDSLGEGSTYMTARALRRPLHAKRQVLQVQLGCTPQACMCTALRQARAPWQTFPARSSAT